MEKQVLSLTKIMQIQGYYPGYLISFVRLLAVIGNSIIMNFKSLQTGFYRPWETPLTECL